MIVPGNKAHFLSGQDKLAIAQDYIDNAPEGTNMAQLDSHKRWHLSSRDCYGRWHDGRRDVSDRKNPVIYPRDCSTCSEKEKEERLSDCWYICTGRAGANWYKRRIEWGHPDYPDARTLDGRGRKRTAGPSAFEYADSQIQDDVAVSYRSEKYPFLEAVQSTRSGHTSRMTMTTCG